MEDRRTRPGERRAAWSPRLRIVAAAAAQEPPPAPPFPYPIPMLPEREAPTR